MKTTNHRKLPDIVVSQFPRAAQQYVVCSANSSPQPTPFFTKPVAKSAFSTSSSIVVFTWAPSQVLFDWRSLKVSSREGHAHIFPNIVSNIKYQISHLILKCLSFRHDIPCKETFETILDTIPNTPLHTLCPTWEVP